MHVPDDSDGLLGGHVAFDHKESGHDGGTARDSRVTVHEHSACRRQIKQNTFSTASKAHSFLISRLTARAQCAIDEIGRLVKIARQIERDSVVSGNAEEFHANVLIIGLLW